MLSGRLYRCLAIVRRPLLSVHDALAGPPTAAHHLLLEPRLDLTVLVR
jgi:hypothetical protein